MASHAHGGHEHTGGCCAAGHDHTEHDAEFMSDPTLASCCERDQRQFEKAMDLKRVLTAHDPTSGGVRLRQQLFQPTAQDFMAASQKKQTPDPVLVAPQRPRSVSDDDDSDLDDDDSDFELDDMDAVLASRRKELEAQIQVALQNAVDGYGVVSEVDAAALTQELKSVPEVPRVVFVSSSTQWDAMAVREMVNEMGHVAKKFLGTKFYMVPVRDDRTSGSDAMVRDLRLKSVPCVVAFRNGEKVDSASLDEKSVVDAATRWEARLVPWLNMCNVLSTTRQEKLRTSSSQKKKQTRDEVRDDDTPAYDCGVENCRIRYGFEHEHVGPSQESKSEISSWRNAA